MENTIQEQVRRLEKLLPGSKAKIAQLDAEEIYIKEYSSDQVCYHVERLLDYDFNPRWKPVFVGTSSEVLRADPEHLFSPTEARYEI